MQTLFRLAVTGLLPVFVAAPVLGQSAPQLVSLRRIWDYAPHNAFTDLVRHNGTWYCSFREAAQHGVVLGGAARVLRSTDGENWTSAAFLTSPTEDYRDPHLVITPDNRLMLYAAAATPVAIDGVTHRNFVWFSSNGTDWTERTEIGEPNIWLWRITWHEGVAYGVGYHWTPTVFIRLYTSTDGLNFSPLVANMGATGTVNESSRIIFLPDGTAQVLVRDARWGTSLPPYTQWNWTPTNLTVGGPEMIRLPDGRYIAVTRLSNNTVRTSLSWVDPATGALTECLTLPSGGDTSYAGLVWQDGLLWISYYSSHEGKSAVYLAKVAFPEPILGNISDTFSRADSDDLGSTEQPQFPWVERLTIGPVADVARISGQQLLLFGDDGAGPAGSGPGVAGLDVDLPDVVVSADVRFMLDDTPRTFGNNTAGFVLRRPRSDAGISDVSSAGQILVQVHPGGGIYIGQKAASGSTINALFADNPFVAGQQQLTQLNRFFGPGSLPTSWNDALFDTDADGILESTEPFRLAVALAGSSIRVLINGSEVASATVEGSAGVPASYVGLLKNRWTSDAAGAPSHVKFDDLFILRAGTNDHCADATTIADGVVRGSTFGATPDGTSSCGSQADSPDVWYRYFAPATGELHLNACGSGTATAVSVLEGCGGTELACSRSCPLGACAAGGSCLTVPVIQGGSYLLRVSTELAEGDFELEVRTQPPQAITHRGQNDPLAESPAWTLDTNTSEIERVLAPGETGRPHWLIRAAAGRRANYQYNLNPPQWSHPDGWTLTARVRPVSAPSLYQCYLEVNDDRDAWIVSLVTSGGSLSPGVWTSGSTAPADKQLANLDPSAEYHTLQMLYDPTADANKGAVSYYLDGQQVGSQTRDQAVHRSLQRVVWGDNVSGGAQSESRWAFVRFETGRHPLAPCGNPFADADKDGDVDQADFGAFQSCYSGDTQAVAAGCSCFDLDETGTVNLEDLRFFLECASGPDVAADVSCDD